jgi:hypothetical protein
MAPTPDDRAPPEADPAEARTPPARPDEHGAEAERTDREAADAPRRTADGGRSHGTSAEAAEEIAGRPGTTQHVPRDGVPPGADRER